MKSYLFILTIMASFFQVTANSGQFDVRLVLDHNDYENNTTMVRIEVKASTAATNFYLSDQNYRFTFNQDALSNPRVGNAMLTGLVTTSSPVSSSFFAPHTIHGSKGAVVSYNVVLQGGHGYPLNETTWVPVGMVEFDIVDLTACANLHVHTKIDADFPPTFIGEKNSDVLFESTGGKYTDLNYCFETAEETVVTDIEAPLEDAEVKGFTVFPNPALAGNMITISAPIAIEGVKLMDVLGKSLDVNGAILGGKEMQLNLNERLATGTYILEITTSDKRTLVEKLIIR